MDCETDDCRKEKRGCKGCFYSDGKEDEDINPEIIKIIKYCRARECDECKYNINDEICALHNPSAWNVQKVGVDMEIQVGDIWKDIEGYERTISSI